MRIRKEIVSRHRSNRQASFLVISPFTLGTPYETEIKEMQASLVEHDVPHIIYGYDSLGSWRKNCNATVVIILEALLENPEYNIVWIDADAIVHEYPELFETLTCDIGAYKRLNSSAYIRGHKCKKGYHWETGTLFYKNDPKVRQFLQNQIRIMDEVAAGKSKESYMANDLLESCDLVIGELPISYSLIIGTNQPEEMSVAPVISHKLHGYKYRKVIR